MKVCNNNYSIDPLEGATTSSGYAECTVIAMKAFPKLSTGFFEILNQRALALKFSDKKLMSAINHVIDTCQFPEPTLAQFLQYDASIKLYDYNQKIGLINELGGDIANSLYKAVRINDRKTPLYAHIDDINKYGLELFNK